VFLRFINWWQVFCCSASCMVCEWKICYFTCFLWLVEAFSFEVKLDFSTSISCLFYIGHLLLHSVKDWLLSYLELRNSRGRNVVVFLISFIIWRFRVQIYFEQLIFCNIVTNSFFLSFFLLSRFILQFDW
jgi:hypothetical protein